MIVLNSGDLVIFDCVTKEPLWVADKGNWGHGKELKDNEKKKL